MTTHQQNLDAVRLACFKATGTDEDDVFYDPTAADVLLALGKVNVETFSIDDQGNVCCTKYGVASGRTRNVKLCTLDLRATLSSWDEATVAALANLLKKDD